MSAYEYDRLVRVSKTEAPGGVTDVPLGPLPGESDRVEGLGVYVGELAG